MAKGNFLSEADIDYLEKRLKKIFATKDDLRFRLQDQKDDIVYKMEEIMSKYRSKTFDKLDKILKEILASRQEQTVLSGHVKELFDRVESLEETTQ